MRTRNSHKQDEGDEVVVYDTDWSATQMSDNVPLPQHDAAGLAYFQQSKANLKNVASDSENFCWLREYGDRHILCWKTTNTNASKDIQLIVVGKIKSAALEVPNTYGAYTIDLLLDDESQQAFDRIWKSGRLHGTGLNVPINNMGVAKFSAKMNSINRDARKNKMDFSLTEHDPFPGLHDGRMLHKNNTALVPRAAGDFTAGITVAVKATVATYDFVSNDGVHRSGYSLGPREVYWLDEDGDRSDDNLVHTKCVHGGADKQTDAY